MLLMMCPENMRSVYSWRANRPVVILSPLDLLRSQIIPMPCSVFTPPFLSGLKYLRTIRKAGKRTLPMTTDTYREKHRTQYIFVQNEKLKLSIVSDFSQY